MQVRLEKNFSHGLQFEASYTYAHALDDASSAALGSLNNGDFRNQRLPSTGIWQFRFRCAAPLRHQLHLSTAFRERKEIWRQCDWRNESNHRELADRGNHLGFDRQLVHSHGRGEQFFRQAMAAEASASSKFVRMSPAIPMENPAYPGPSSIPARSRTTRFRSPSETRAGTSFAARDFRTGTSPSSRCFLCASKCVSNSAPNSSISGIT